MDRCLQGEISRMIKYAEGHYKKNVSVAEIAAAAGYSEGRGNLLFKACCGETIGAFLRRIRMEYAYRALSEGVPPGRIARSLRYTPRGFGKAFLSQYGVLPSQFRKDVQNGGVIKRRYDYLYSEKNWGDGANPTPDGLWEYGYYDPKSGNYALMKWNERDRYFQAPYLPYPEGYNDPLWYTLNRERGFGMHPGRATQAVKTFICPYSGVAEFLVFIGRLQKVNRNFTPCFAQLYHNETPLTEPLVLSDLDPHRLFAVCTVSAGDRLRLHVDSMGNQKRDGVFLYRESICYTEISGVD